MLEGQDREAPTVYGPWAGLAGYAIGGMLMALMFTLATGRF